MTGYTLTCKDPKKLLGMDGAIFTPALDPTTLAEWFDIEGEPGNRLTLRNCPPLDNLGAKMTGGELIIEGDAGDNLGSQMRRGLIRVTGKAGKCAGYRMRAGTIVIGRGPYDHPGLEMRRGTIICLDSDAPLDTGNAFALDGLIDATAVPTTLLVMRHLGLKPPTRWHFYSGDRFEMGKGEIWQRAN